jgi:RNA polymerase sigma-70 factor (ECF subfamily)
MDASVNQEHRDPGGASQQVQLVQKLFIRHSPKLRAYLLPLAVDVGAVDDILHSAFLAATAKAAQYEQGTNFVAWARAIARLELLQFSRQRRRWPHLLSPEAIDSLSEDAPEVAVDDERLAAIRHCVEQLAPRSREAMDLRYSQSLPPSEVAQRMQLGLQSVHVMLSRARTAVQQCAERVLRRRGKGATE